MLDPDAVGLVPRVARLGKAWFHDRILTFPLGLPVNASQGEGGIILGFGDSSICTIELNSLLHQSVD